MAREPDQQGGFDRVDADDPKPAAPQNRALGDLTLRSFDDRPIAPNPLDRDDVPPHPRPAERVDLINPAAVAGVNRRGVEAYFAAQGMLPFGRQRLLQLAPEIRLS